MNKPASKRGLWRIFWGYSVDANESSKEGLEGSVLTLTTFAFTTSVAMTIALAGVADSILGERARYLALVVYIIISLFPLACMVVLLNGTVPDAKSPRRVRVLNDPSVCVGRIALGVMVGYPLLIVFLVASGILPLGGRKLFSEPSILCTSEAGIGFQSLKHSGNLEINHLVDYTVKALPPGNIYIFQQMTPFVEDYESFAVHIDVNVQAEPSPDKKPEITRAFLLNRNSKGIAKSIRPLHVPEYNNQTTRTIVVDRPDKESVIVIVFCSPGKIDQSMLNLRKE